MNVELSNITKRFGSVVANDSVDLAFRSGEVLALLGENGAGKSTLMKVLCGVVLPDSGEIRVDGRSIDVSSPARARALGIGMVFQHFSLIPALSVEENLILGAPGVPLFGPLRGSALEHALGQLRDLAPGLDPRRRASDLSVSEKQLVELAKVLARGAKVVVLDEPTSVLTRLEAERLTRRLRGLAAEGRAVVLITHKLEDVRDCADRAVVMRGGRISEETRAVDDVPRLLRAMLGEEPAPRATRPARAVSAARLELSSVSASSGTARLQDVSFEARGGEVLGVAGVTGNGQELLGRILAGVVAPAFGSIRLNGQELRTIRADRRKIGYIPEQPLDNGMARGLSILFNLTALDVRSFPFFPDFAEQRRRAEALVERFDVRPRDVDRNPETLSGGNVQKLVVARELREDVSAVIACFPTMGLDAQARAAVEGELLLAADRGAAVVWISEDVEVLLENADRIAVLHGGRLRGPLDVAECSLDRLGLWMTGAAA